MTVKDMIGVLKKEQSIVIKGDDDVITSGFIRTKAKDAPVYLLARRVKQVYPHPIINDEIIIEIV